MVSLLFLPFKSLIEKQKFNWETWNMGYKKVEKYTHTHTKWNEMHIENNKLNIHIQVQVKVNPN